MSFTDYAFPYIMYGTMAIFILNLVSIMFIVPTSISGKVSSIRTSDFIMCQTTVETYGGISLGMLCNDMTKEIEVDKTCDITTQGLYVKKVECG